MATDLRQLSAEQLLTLINSENSIDLTLDVVNFSSPVSLENDSDNKDTAVTVQSKPNSGYVGDVDVKYNRLDLEGFLQYGNPVLEIPKEGTMTDIVEAFNEYYDANLTLEEDIATIAELPVIDYLGTTLLLQASEESFAYRGSIEVDVRYTSEALSDIIANGLLSGLDWPKDGIAGNVEILDGVIQPFTLTTLISTGDYIYSIAGVNSGNGTSSNAVRKITLDGNSITNVTTIGQISSSGGGSSAILKDDVIYVFGASGSILANKINTVTDQISSIPNNIPNPYSNRRCILVNEDIYLYGGTFGQPTPTQYRTLVKLSTVTDTFSSLAASPNIGADFQYEPLELEDGRIRFFGCSNVTRQVSYADYNPVTNTWSSVTTINTYLPELIGSTKIKMFNSNGISYGLLHIFQSGNNRYSLYQFDFASNNAILVNDNVELPEIDLTSSDSYENRSIKGTAIGAIIMGGRTNVSTHNKISIIT